MRKLAVFNNVSLDGYFTDKNGDMSWAHEDDAEWNAFVADNASGGGTLLFGRVTYELMASFWPTPFAAEQLVGQACLKLEEIWKQKLLTKKPETPNH